MYDIIAGSAMMERVLPNGERERPDHQAEDKWNPIERRTRQKTIGPVGILSDRFEYRGEPGKPSGDRARPTPNIPVAYAGGANRLARISQSLEKTFTAIPAP